MNHTEQKGAFCLLLYSLTAAAAWLCVRRYADTNDIQKSIRLYLPIAAALALAFRLLGLPLLYAIGAQLCGLVVLAWISNYYFYH